MGVRSSYDLLPPDIQAGIDAILRDGRFADYSGLTQRVNAFLVDSGFEVEFKRSTLAARGKQLQDILAKVKESHQAAQYVMEAFPEDEERVSEATIRLVQERMFSLLMDLPMDGALDAKDLAAIARAAADITRANIGERKWRQEMRERMEGAVAEVSQTLKAQGISDETAAQIRQKFLGLVG